MTPQEYRNAIDQLGLTQGGAARFFGVADVTGRRWAAMAGEGPSPPVAKFLRYMVAKRLTPAVVDEALGRKARRKR